MDNKKSNELPQFEKISPKEMEALRDFARNEARNEASFVVDQRLDQVMRDLPRILADAGIKVPQPETLKERLIRAIPVAIGVGIAVATSMAYQRYIDKPKKTLELETSVPTDGNRVRPVGSQRATASLN